MYVSVCMLSCACQETIFLFKLESEFVSDRMLFILLRGCYWCGSIVLNVPASAEDKSNDLNHRLYEELEFVFSQILHTT